MSSADTRAFETLKGFNNEKFNAIIVRSLSNNIPDFPMKKKRGGTSEKNKNLLTVETV